MLLMTLQWTLTMALHKKDPFIYLDGQVYECRIKHGGILYTNPYRWVNGEYVSVLKPTKHIMMYEPAVCIRCGMSFREMLLLHQTRHYNHNWPECGKIKYHQVKVPFV